MDQKSQQKRDRRFGRREIHSPAAHRHLRWPRWSLYLGHRFISHEYFPLFVVNSHWYIIFVSVNGRRPSDFRKTNHQPCITRRPQQTEYWWSLRSCSGTQQSFRYVSGDNVVPPNQSELILHIRCATCRLTYFTCPGHFGHIELPAPAFHPLFMNNMFNILRGTCLFCHRFKLSRTVVSIAE